MLLQPCVSFCPGDPAVDNLLIDVVDVGMATACSLERIKFEVRDDDLYVPDVANSWADLWPLVRGKFRVQTDARW